jgi:hypothetical protein
MGGEKHRQASRENDFSANWLILSILVPEYLPLNPIVLAPLAVKT